MSHSMTFSSHWKSDKMVCELKKHIFQCADVLSMHFINFRLLYRFKKKCARVHFIAHKTFTKPFKKKKKKILNHCMNCLYSCLLAGRLLHCLCWHIVTQNVRNDKMLLVPVMHIHLHNTNTTGTVKSGQKPHRVPLSDAKNRSVTETFKSKNRPLNL